MRINVIFGYFTPTIVLHLDTTLKVLLIFKQGVGRAQLLDSCQLVKLGYSDHSSLSRAISMHMQAVKTWVLAGGIAETPSSLDCSLWWNT